jgi:hypothetical protein
MNELLTSEYQKVAIDLLEALTDLGQARAENAALRAERDAALIDLDISRSEHTAMTGIAKAFCDDFIKSSRIAQQFRAENAALRAALETIAQGIDPYADQLQNWIAGQIDTALGKGAT